jgi:hypothetical protein
VPSQKGCFIVQTSSHMLIRIAHWEVMNNLL